MNAIILAAGLGSRFKELSRITHKAMLKIHGVPNIERTIVYLKKAQINEIYIVVGHLKEQFEYLKEKHNVELIFNENYEKYNSIYSFYRVSEFFNDSFVIDCDVVFNENIFLQKQSFSTYYCILRNTESEWYVKLEKDLIVSIDTSLLNGLALLGVSYFCASDCVKIRENLRKFLTPIYLLDKKMYWDNIVLDMLSNLKIQAIEVKNCYEMDNLKEYEEILNKCKR
ncbi:sugar-1-phosphate nucleotidyltransferase [Campylobacter insulaenigrae]|uniref:NTP transferase domain-containing protein n=1 Tax=Campylobacter insulaenigrae TaxID=260714 RepID=UPI000F6F9845|nr:NTP transferase domain-containing protein [Campylobacter insulaenigrae]MCR6591982.1 NTP transferase domain-containing protein [Campylobacter insulaenigrae]MCR6593494.1 NTP transferase domain-containing protein [Campylobacter insulaenigrae]VEJ52237.1 sugar-1-phosphate nucleotidyltransferase [Campylobacter insulaenigrae]